MAKKYQIWDEKSPVYTFFNKVYAPRPMDSYVSLIENSGAVPIVSAGVINGAFCGELNQMKINCKTQGAVFEEGLSNQELLDAIEEFESTEASPTQEQRISTLESENLSLTEGAVDLDYRILMLELGLN